MHRWLWSCLALIFLASPVAHGGNLEIVSGVDLLKKFLPSREKRRVPSLTARKFRACKMETTLDSTYEYCTHLARSSLISEREIHECGRQAIGTGPFRSCLDQVLSANRLRVEVDQMMDELTRDPPVATAPPSSSAPR